MEDLLSFVGIGQPCAPEKNCARTVPPSALRRAATQHDAKNEGGRVHTALSQWLALGALTDEGSAHQRRKLRVRFDESTKASKDSPRNRGFRPSPKSPEELFTVNARVQRVEKQIALAKQRASAAARGAHGGHDKDTTASSSLRRAPSTSSNDSADSSDSKGQFGPAVIWFLNVHSGTKLQPFITFDKLP